MDPSIEPAQQLLIEKWLKQTLVAMSTIHGAYPSDHFSITVRPYEHHNSWFDLGRSPDQISPVPWGQIRRGNRNQPDEVLLVVNLARSYGDLVNDWTIYHELSHLLIPYRYGARWFTEGLASYYQNLVQARHGLFDEKTMWRKLMSGFERGVNADRYDGHSLSRVSRESLRGTTMRVYWSGVLYWLEIDVALREAGSSLDEALLNLKKHLELQGASGRYSANTIAQLLDTANNTKLFTTRFTRFAASTRMPPYLPIFKKLGIEPSAQDVILKSASLSQVRTAISQPRHAEAFQD